MLMEEIEVQKATNGISNSNIKNNKELDKHFQDLETSFMDFSSKLEVYDPLEREIMDEDN